MCHLAFFVVLASFLSDALCNGQVSYDQHGTDWGGTCSRGKRQSPIPFSRVVKNYDPESQVPFTINYKNSIVSIQPNDHSVNAIMGDSSNRILGGGLDAEYKLMSFHMHWPSEHAILNDDVRSSLEFHFVHIKSKYKDVPSALASNDGKAIAVLGVFFDVGKKAHKEVQKLIDETDRINKAGEKVGNNSGIIIRNLLPSDMDRYYRYEGSLTTPPCSEAVVWTLFTERQTVSQEQVNWFPNVVLEGKPLKENYREMLSDRHRKIYGVGIIGIDYTDAFGEATLIRASMLPFLFVIALFYI